ncbi:PD40 domain-containing protein [Aquimarina spongiae]|uniref:WD40-like Beta Propeller Repeat n=1 Tax=Aquimarina spongiae TaxID=570521 RepID=A0A1M6B5L1_9FLAO|nr:PD40 domain-containing protein [Aquimarina spongiae]SHI44006.1 WD40-like Beta Propeller Repeat [Aquimarina spongiae]
MKKNNFILILIGILNLTVYNIWSQQSNSNQISTSENAYLGQQPPGLTPELFAPDMISTKEHLEIEGVFAPGMKEFYFTRQVQGEKPKTHVFQLKNNTWQESYAIPRTGEVAISTDGNTMYLGNEYKTRKNSGWSNQKSLGSSFKKYPIMRLTASSKSTYVFDERDTIGTIRYSRLVNGKRETPRTFTKEINTGTWVAHPFIAPDESYIIWDAERKGGYGDSDLYISFRKKDGAWGPAINMGKEINSKYEDAFGSVTPDGKYFFFHRVHISEEGFAKSHANIYWVDAKVIENLKTKAKEQQPSNKGTAAIQNPYLGQKPPGRTPERFAPGIVAKLNWEYGGTFTPDMKEFYFLREVGEKEEDKKMEFVVFQYKDNQWEESVISPRVGQPFIAPDGRTMHLGRRYKERTETGEWSEIKKLGSLFEEIRIMRLTASSKGTYVFDEVGMPGGNGIIRYSRLIDGKREAPKPFEKQINTGKMNAHPFIAPDESYILWDGRRESGFGNSDIYVSFKQPDGSWGEAINLGETINTEAWEAAASVTPDGKYLFFNRNVGKVKATDKYDNIDIFWVDAQIIEKLRPK